MSLRRTIAAGLATVLTAATLVSCSGSDSSSDTLILGTTDASQQAFKELEKQAEKNGIDLELKNFSAYPQVNPALSEGQIDVNLFQHPQYLSVYNVKNNDTLVPVGSTAIYPLALFWKGHDSLDGIEGQEVVIPNDPTNQGRAINLLASKGLVTLKDSAKGMTSPTKADIEADKTKVSLKTVDAAQTSAAYGEGKPAVLNNTFVGRAGIDPTTAVIQDDPNSPEAEPYINVFVTREENKDDPRVQKLVELWHTPEVQAAEKEDSKGTSVEVKKTPEELQAIEKRLEDAERAAAK